MKRVEFNFTVIGAAGAATTQLATLTFTSPIAGTALLHSRGICRLTGGATENRINVAAGPTLATIFTTISVPQWAALSTPVGAPSQQVILSYDSETAQSVNANVATTVFLGARHELGTLAADCAGTFDVQVVGALN